MNAKMIMQWVAAVTLAGVTLTTVNAQPLIAKPLINDEDYFGSSRTDNNTITLANGKVYSRINPNGWPGADTNGYQITSESGIVTYRAFDNSANNFTLGGMQAGEKVVFSLGLTITAASVSDVWGNHSLNLGFVSYGLGSDQSVAYVWDNIGGGYGSGLYQNAGSSSMSTWSPAAGKGTTWNSPAQTVNFKDLATHEALFSIEAAGSGEYWFTYLLGGEQITRQKLAWDLDNVMITGVALTPEGSPFALDYLNVTYFKLDMVPEPSTVFLLGTGVALLAFLRRRK